ncbi:dynein axonemal intermediate chain 3-like isoform X2 [Rhopalosiphum padi]|uniref:dynein axonemal intermediate chain 3-like isoform X2 n=1 Tax=Rhopalosiphum padi TaxID=40932 RepID=UPI00298E5297|nr:dynein axonemal intermediate chain 3-like isoform X2 [Rhopalosiphum padi]
MSSKKKINSLSKVNNENSMEQVISIDSDHFITEPIEIHKDDLKIVFIPKTLHEHFECVIGKHVFIDKPWTKIFRTKIIDNMQSQNADSCFWQFKKEIEGITNDYVLVGYKPFSSTDEEFLICTTDKAKQFIEETQIQTQGEIKKKVERPMCRVPGPWESKSSEKDIEEIKPVQTREKIAYKWKLPAGRLQAEAEFEDALSKSIKNDYVKLEPRPKEIFKSNDALTMESSVQAVRQMVNREMQTIPRIKYNKCIQSVAVEEDMFQLQPQITSEKALDDFLNKHVPNLVNQLHYNELYDLYRDDYKLLKNENENEIEQVSKVIKLLPGYQNEVSKKRYVSCQTWHPTIAGIFAVSYTINSNELYKTVSLETSDDEITKSTAKDEKYGVSYSDDDIDTDSWSNRPETKLLDENYKEKIISLLNKEFVQRMRIIQLTDDEKNNQQHSHDIDRQLRNSLIYVSHEQISTYNDLPLVNSDNGTLIDENIIIKDGQSELTDENEYEIQNNEMHDTKKSANMMSITNKNEYDNNMDVIDHHDSDTESFYNIWGDDEEWLYDNKLRNAVRNIHREFNKKYDREAREEKLFRLLKSEAKYTEKKNKLDDMEKERIKLTKDMFEAGDMSQKLKYQLEFKSKKRRKSLSKHKSMINDEVPKNKSENIPIMDDQNNSVFIWSVNDNIFPKLRLESAEEVRCIEFNPRHGNTVVGGLKNGQISIWDIEGKLETTGLNDLNMSEKEKKHHKHLWEHMKWSLDVEFETRIKPAALSAILESHLSTVTAIQWIHPTNEITPLGAFINVQEGQFSDQFFSASMDGTIKLWDLKSTPMPRIIKKSTTNTSFNQPEKLNNYKSPLSIYNNCLKPSYTIIIREPEKTTHSPITALSFEIPLMHYKYTSDKPLSIGKRLFEYVPTKSNDPNRILVVGSIMGQIGVVTWNGYDTHQQGRNSEECKNIWWGQVHDGPINYIKRNVFYPDIHLVCGGHVVSIWSLSYKGGPVWWKRFNDLTNSVLWSTTHPAEFRVSFNTNGILQFWNFMKHTHKPYYTTDIFISDGLIATLSAPYSPIHFIDTEWLTFTEGLHEVLNYKKNELISFSDSTGTIMMITTDAVVMEPNTIEEVGRVFQKEVIWRKELDAWNSKYKEEFRSIAENDEDGRDYKAIKSYKPNSVHSDNIQPTLSQEQIKRNIIDETLNWCFNQKGPQTRLGKMRDKYLQREKRHMIEAMMKKKNIDQKQLEEYFKGIEENKYDKDDITNMKFEANESYRDIVNKILSAEQTKEHILDVDSKRGESVDMKKTVEKIQQLLVTDIAIEKEKLSNYIKNSPFKADQEDWAEVIEFAEKNVRNRLNDPTLLKSPALRLMRREWAKKYINEGYKIKEWKTRKDEHACDRYNIRNKNIDVLKTMYGKSYNPYWDKDLRPQKMRDAIRMRLTEAADNDDERLHESYFDEKRGGDNSCYTNYLSLMGPRPISGFPEDYSGISKKELSIHDDDESETRATEFDGFNRNNDRAKIKDPYKSKRLYNECDEYQDLETVDEQDHED